MQRSSIIRGPAVISFGSQVIYSAGNIRVTQKLKTFGVPVSTAGRADLRVQDIVTEISFQPAGQWTSGHLGVLYPTAYRNPTIGASIYGSDAALAILPVAGDKIEFPAAALVKMPDAIFQNGKTALGTMTFRCIGKDNTAWSDAAARFTITDPTAFSDTSFAYTQVPTLQYTAALSGASAPWDSFVSQTGFVVSPGLRTEPITLDGVVVDEQIAGVDVTVKFTPVGVDVADVLTLLKIQGTGVRPGMSLAAAAADLTIAGAGTGVPTITVNKVAPDESMQNYGPEASQLRHGEMQLVSTRPSGTGAIFSVGITT